MFTIGQLVTRKGSNKVWEISKVTDATQVYGSDELKIEWYGAADAPLYELKNPESKKSARSVKYSADKLTAV